MNEEQKITDALEQNAPTLSTTEREDLWHALEGKLATTPIPSPYLSFFNSKKHMAPIAIALMLMLGGTGVVAAAENARPGDSLFVIEQKIEDLRLALASEDKKTQLEAKFAAERLLELSSILNESVNKSVVATTSASTTRGFEAEADVFTDITIIEVEINDRKTIFASNETSKEAIVAEISARFNIPKAQVEARLDFEIEDRASRAEERSTLTLSQENEVRVNNAVAITLGYLLNGSFGDDEREDLLEELSLLIDGVPVKLSNDRLRLQDTNTWVEVRDDDDDSRIEIRDGNDRIRIREKDGEIRIDTKGDWDDQFDDDDRSDDDSDDRDDDSRDDDAFEAEADVFGDKTIVEVEINDRKTVFETNAKTRDAVVTEIMNRFGVTRAQVEANLDFEVEDRSSRSDDSDDDSRDDDSDDRDDDRDDDRIINVSGGLQLNLVDDDRDDSDDRDDDDDDRDDDSDNEDEDDDSDDRNDDDSDDRDDDRD